MYLVAKNCSRALMKTGSATWSTSFTKPHVTTRLWDEAELNCLDRKQAWTMERICCSLELNVMKKTMAAASAAGLLLCLFISVTAGTSNFQHCYIILFLMALKCINLNVCIPSMTKKGKTDQFYLLITPCSKNVRYLFFFLIKCFGLVFFYSVCVQGRSLSL